MRDDADLVMATTLPRRESLNGRSLVESGSIHQYSVRRDPGLFQGRGLDSVKFFR